MVPIKELAEKIDRQVPTIRKWVANEVLPSELLPGRDRRGRFFWHRDQVRGIVKWMHTYNRTNVKTSATDVAPMTEDQIDRYLEGVRKKRDELRQLRDEVGALREEVRQIKHGSWTDTADFVVAEEREPNEDKE